MPSAILLMSLLKGLGCAGSAVRWFSSYFCVSCISNGKILKRIKELAELFQTYTRRSCYLVTSHPYSSFSICWTLACASSAHKSSWRLSSAISTGLIWVGLALRSICLTPELKGNRSSMVLAEVGWQDLLVPAMDIWLDHAIQCNHTNIHHFILVCFHCQRVAFLGTCCCRNTMITKEYHLQFGSIQNPRARLFTLV